MRGSEIPGYFWTDVLGEQVFHPLKYLSQSKKSNWSMKTVCKQTNLCTSHLWCHFLCNSYMCE